VTRHDQEVDPVAAFSEDRAKEIIAKELEVDIKQITRRPSSSRTSAPIRSTSWSW